MENPNGDGNRPSLRLRPSDPAYRNLSRLADMIARAVNPHMVVAMVNDIPDPEIGAIVSILKEEMTSWIDAGVFANYLSEEAGD